MAQNFIQSGDVLDYVNGTGSAIASGDVVIVGSLAGIALVDIPDTETGAVQLEGIFKIGKTTSLVITQGDKLYWNTGTKKVTKTVTDKFIGTAAASALSADTVVYVNLLGTSTAPQATVVIALTDNSGGAAADGTIAAVSDVATAANAIKELATKQNEIITVLKAAGLMASS